MEKNKSICQVENALLKIGGRWKALILHELFKGSRRFGALRRALNGIAHKVLAQQLREMEKDGMIRRKAYLQVPPKVEYSLTSLGKELGPALEALHLWGVKQSNEERADLRPEVVTKRAGRPLNRLGRSKNLSCSDGAEL